MIYIPAPLRCIFKFLFVCLAGSIVTQAYADPVVIPDKKPIPILNPTFSDQKTLKLRLDNGLEAYIISDPAAEKSAAALTVNIGSWHDPDEFPGMAHFVEHLLFLGTQKYPEESAFDRFVSEHGGSSNAFTDNLDTLYVFTLENKAFSEGLDRFASFFKEPLFNPSGVGRELNAIEQEYASDLNDDDWRVSLVEKALGNPEHPDHRFNIGNTETLSPVSQEELKKWFEEHYSSNLMHLAVYSSYPIDQLKEWVIRDFSGVPNRQISLYDDRTPTTSEKLNGCAIYIEPLKNTRSLTLQWELSSPFAEDELTKSGMLIAYVLGHEGEKSLYTQLKKENLATAIIANSERIAPHLLKLSLQIDLTSEGLKKVEKVIERCFQTIAALREKPFPRYLFDEVQRIAMTSVQFPKRGEAMTIASKHGAAMIQESLETYPTNTLVPQKFDPEFISQLVNQLTPEKSQFIIVAPFSTNGIKPEFKEKWMDVPYSIKCFSQDKLEAWRLAQSYPEIQYPPPNPFIPKHLALVKSYEKQKKITFTYPHPEPIIDNEEGKIYFAFDEIYFSPEVSWIFDIKTPVIDAGDAQSVALADLYVKCSTNELNEFSYNATIAGLAYDIKRSDYGIKVHLAGYSENALSLLQEIIKVLTKLPLSESKFKVCKEFLLREYQNVEQESPLDKAKEVFKCSIYKDFVSASEKAKALKKITYQDFTTFVPSIFEKTYTEGMLYGNSTEQQAEEMWKILQAAFHSTLPFPKKDQKKQQVKILPTTGGPHFLEVKSKSQGNAVLLGIEASPFSFKARAAQLIISQAMGERFYTTLRTQQQTGYIVYSWEENIENQLFWFFADQSSSHEVRDLLSRFELFIESFLQEIDKEELTEERFQVIQQALVAVLEQPPQSINDMNDILQKLAFKYDGNFDWVDQLVAAIKTLSHQDCLEYAQLYLGKDNKRRLAIFAKGKMPQDNTLEYIKKKNLSAVRDLGRYK